MNRKSKTILFWIFAGLFIALFVIGLGFGSVKSIFEVGSDNYNQIAKFLGGLANVIFTWSPFACLASGVILCIMFFKRYNSRIN